MVPDPHEARLRARILVVDDVPEICALFHQVLRRLNMPASEALVLTDPREALARVRTQPFDVVVCDYRMRGLDGLSILREARARHPQGLRVLMTGYNVIPATMDDITSAAVDAYVIKPLPMPDLLLLLSSLLSRDADAVNELRAEARRMERYGLLEERMRTASAIR